MNNTSLKIVSLLPSTTEIVCALGRVNNLAGRSHECDYPPAVKKLPACTEPKFEPDGTSYQIEQRVKALLQEGLSIYRVDADKLSTLQPDVIITQDHCEVCAASLSEVREAVKEKLGEHVTLVSVSPTDLSGVYDSIRTIATAIDAETEGRQLIQQMKAEFDKTKDKAEEGRIKNICCLEWLDPLMTAGNWVPELAAIAGGNALGSEAGEHSPWFQWDELLTINPEVLAIMPCGYAIEQTLSEMDTLVHHPKWHPLKAVQENEVYLLDGNRYFNRPGPRLTDSARIFAEILHPDIFQKDYRDSSWIKFETQNINVK